MKKIQQAYKMIFLLIAVSVFGNTCSLGKEVTDSFEKTYKVNKTDLLILNSYDSDIKFITWDKSEIKIKGEIIANGNDDEDIEELLKAFKDIEGRQYSNTLEFKTNFIKGRVIIMGIGRTILENGDRLNVGKVKTSFTFWVPEEIGLEMKAKYNKTEIPDIKGEIDVEVYDGKLYMGDIGEKFKIKLTYSDGVFGNGGSGDIELYESELEMGNVNNVELFSKYSEIKINSVQALDMQSYEDEVEFNKIGEFKLGAKYSNFEIMENAISGRFDFYETNLFAVDFDKIEFNGKYSKLRVKNVSALISRTMYECKITANDVGIFRCDESKYDEIRFVTINKELELREGYETKLDIEKVSPSCEAISGKFQYGNVSMGIAETLDFDLDFHAKYADTNIPRERFKNGVNIIKESSNYTFEGATSPNAKLKMTIRGYDFDFTIL